MLKNFVNIPLHGWVINHPHHPRAFWTRRINSSCDKTWTSPLSNSRSRSITTSSDTSMLGGGSVSNSLQTKSARSRSGSALASCSISLSFMSLVKSLVRPASRVHLRRVPAFQMSPTGDLPRGPGRGANGCGGTYQISASDPSRSQTLRQRGGTEYDRACGCCLCPAR